MRNDFRVRPVVDLTKRAREILIRSQRTTGMGLDGQLNVISEPVGTVEVALGHAARLLERDAALAAEQASEILKAVPGHPHARLILGAAHRVGGQTRLALEILDPLAREQPRSVRAHLELAVARGEAGHVSEAIASL